MHAGARIGTASMHFTEIRDPPQNFQRTHDVFYATVVSLHTDVEFPCGCCIFQTGFRAEWQYNWLDVFPQDNRSDMHDVNLLLTAGVAAVASGGAVVAGLTALEAGAAIGGGTLAAGLATLPLYAETHQEYSHPRNLLRDVYEGPSTSPLFPPSVWRYLTHQTKTELGGHTYRAELITSWRQEGRLGEPGSDIEHKRLGLFFGEGGVYELQDLRARAAMLNLLGSTVELMHQDLEMLIRQVLIQQALAR